MISVFVKNWGSIQLALLIMKWYLNFRDLGFKLLHWGEVNWLYNWHNSCIYVREKPCIVDSLDFADLILER